MKPVPRRKISHSDEDTELSRIILLSENIDQEPVGEIIRRILEINEEDDKLEVEVKDYVREPIKLIINSYGGSVYDGLGLIDCMDSSKTPIHTICYGSAMSMGMVILACGHVRHAGKYSTIMYHEGSYETDGKVEDHKQELMEAERTEKICDDILIKRTKLNRKLITAIKQKRGEWYLSAESALKHKVVDFIL